MKLSAVVLCALIGAATLEFANSDPSADVCASEDEPQTYSIVKDIINKIIKELEGSKDHRIPKIEIGSKSSLDDILIHSEIGKTTLIMDDSNTRINIKNLTLPVNLLNVEGQYEFEDFPGGLQIYGNGNFSIRIVELNIFVSLEAKV
ncbi:UNVERIFIED_CONTAM: hypothetical protein PYX00_001496 [Menopon gallinae]|uniref:Uncharacterized protein n=1 Tax=Menopon gallinae TaxID=328185 RepID=A0AAW2ICK1_9NEOP